MSSSAHFYPPFDRGRQVCQAGHCRRPGEIKERHRHHFHLESSSNSIFLSRPRTTDHKCRRRYSLFWTGQRPHHQQKYRARYSLPLQDEHSLFPVRPSDLQVSVEDGHKGRGERGGADGPGRARRPLQRPGPAAGVPTGQHPGSD